MRRWDRMTFLFAPKGPKQSSPGGGNPACGVGPGNLGTTLLRALKGRNGGDITRTFTCTALSGLAVGGNSPSLPRALPWADLSWPLRGVVFPRRFSHRRFEEGAGRANSLLCFPCCVDLFRGRRSPHRRGVRSDLSASTLRRAPRFASSGRPSWSTWLPSAAASPYESWFRSRIRRATSGISPGSSSSRRRPKMTSRKTPGRTRSR